MSLNKIKKYKDALKVQPNASNKIQSVGDIYAKKKRKEKKTRNMLRCVCVFEMQGHH